MFAVRREPARCKTLEALKPQAEEVLNTAMRA